MLILKKVAITGGLACGKSSVCRLFRKFGAYVASADEIVHQLLSPSTSIGKKVLDLLGQEIVENNSFDRQKIAQKIFHNKALLSSLESILHPAVFDEIERQYRNAVKQGDASLFVVEIPLLFETGYQKSFDYTIAVVADQDLCRRRFVESTGYSEADYNIRSSNQWSMADKAAKADFVIFNEGDLIELESRVKQVFDQIY
jgi:dephospho-CoA kinase